MNFREAVEATPSLMGRYEVGLQALRAEDKVHIEVEDTRKLTGSVDIDAALRSSEPNANRWDFAIGYKHSNRSDEVIYWAEMHTASDSQVKVVIQKATWLLNWLHSSGTPLASFERDIVWISSGATTFTLSGPQRKQMALAGLQHVGSRLRIPNRR